ncbi:DUF6161 domain-containing protein [Vibrio coralliilyticus]|uniref:DUF6161 domain-containing protein n=1 Tax=Vibrio coralliilyticus TaxID=190893 RepID=UPI0002E7283B|nr:DUF6161 domain-containing protein [Vibrio coralliilyticus]
MDFDENYELKGLLDTSISFDSTEQLQAYVDEQIEHFGALNAEIYQNKSLTIKQIHKCLAQLKSYVDSMANTIKTANAVSIQQRNNLQTHIHHLSNFWVPYGHPIFERLKEVFNEYGAHGEQAFWALATGGFQNPNSHNSMMGMMNAYDYLNQRKAISEITITERDFVEQHYASAIEKGNELEESRNSLNKRVALWEQGRQKSWEEWEQTCDEAWGSLTKNKKTEWASDKAVFNQEHEKLLASSTKKLGELEATYQEHLKLEKPAEYWSNMAKKYDDSSSLWFGVLVLLILTGVAGFAHFYSLYLSGQDTGVTLDSVKGIVLFVSGITIYGFLIRVVSRMLMSATHLKRDSEERAQLTYFYLALIKDGAIDEQSRDIVIQSLFSRTETGLITGDSSPTMPAMDVLKNIKIGN